MSKKHKKLKPCPFCGSTDLSEMCKRSLSMHFLGEYIQCKHPPLPSCFGGGIIMFLTIKENKMNLTEFKQSMQKRFDDEYQTRTEGLPNLDKVASKLIDICKQDRRVASIVLSLHNMGVVDYRFIICIDSIPDGYREREMRYCNFIIPTEERYQDLTSIGMGFSTGLCSVYVFKCVPADTDNPYLYDEDVLIYERENGVE